LSDEVVDVELAAVAAGTGIESGAVHLCWHSWCFVLLVGPFLILEFVDKEEDFMWFVTLLF